MDLFKVVKFYLFIFRLYLEFRFKLIQCWRYISTLIKPKNISMNWIVVCVEFSLKLAKFIVYLAKLNQTYFLLTGVMSSHKER